MSFPVSGRPPQEILKDLDDRKAHDLPWQEGKVFAYIYDAGDEAMQLLKDSFTLYMTENGLDPTSFPSCLEMERDVISWALDLQGGNDQSKGTFTSGGTESILLSVKTARDYYRANKPEITKPELLIPETGHPAFFKACQYFDVTPVVIKVDPRTFEAIPSAMDAGVTPNTIMMVGSFPSYAHGVTDPIPELGQVALKHDILFHVDCCVGGMYMPFVKKLGYDLPDFNLSVPGVTQLSMDFHKWGYAAKGASAILYKDGDLRRHQIFAWSGWTGYTVINPTVQSTKSGGPIAACWAIMQHLGEEGYLNLVGQTQKAAMQIREAIDRIDGIRVLGHPIGNLFAFTADTFNIFALSDLMKKKGWFIQPQFGFSTSPANMHLSVGASNVPQVDAFIADLEESVAILAQGDTEPPAQELPAELAAMLENPTPDLLDNLGSAFGTDGTDLPDEMQGINNIMNGMPSAMRDQILIEFFNRLYAKSLG